MNCLKVSKCNKSLSSRCKRSWWRQFKSNKLRLMKQRNRKEALMRRQAKRWKTWWRPTRVYLRQFLMWKSAIDSCKPKSALSRSIKEFSNMQSRCSANSATYSSLPKYSLIMWRLAQKTVRDNAVCSSRFHSHSTLWILAWCRTSQTIVPTLTMSLKSNSMVRTG